MHISNFKTIGPKLNFLRMFEISILPHLLTWECKLHFFALCFKLLWPQFWSYRLQILCVGRPRRPLGYVRKWHWSVSRSDVMTSFPVFGLSAISRELFIVETSRCHHRVPRRILDQIGWVRSPSVMIDFSLWRHIYPLLFLAISKTAIFIGSLWIFYCG